MKKIALVTGSATRIGKEISQDLAYKGWKVVIHCNSSIKEAEILCKNLTKISEIYVVRQDLQKPEQLDEFFSNIKKNFGMPSLLINNASIFQNDDKLITMKHLETHMHINCFAPILMAQKFYGIEGSNIINIVDASASSAAKDFLSYNLSKAALLHATKSLAIQLAPCCRVNSISPGLVLEPADEHGKKIFKKLLEASPQKHTKIADILHAIDTILATESMTGYDMVLGSGSQAL